MTVGGAAQAAGPSGVEEGPSTQALPQCLEASSDSNDNVHVLNTCSSSYRYKVVMAFAPDLACQTIKPGWEHTYDDPSGRFDGIKSC